jgi:uncharacterized repeat protein (TIGR03943 family)
METPVYLFTGFMDSGKTTLIKDTLQDPDFIEDAKTLLIVCEDGDEEYDPAQLKRSRTVMEVIESEENFTTEHLTELYLKYMPDQVFIEYNGTWQMATFTDLTLPEDWTLVQVLSTVDATTFEVYLQNMRSMILDQLCISDVVIFNRSNEQTPKAAFRRTVKALNRKAQLVYEREDGSIDDQIDEELPYDMSQDFLDISDADYGIFFLDAMENPKNYDGKTIKYRALVYNPDDYKKGCFVPGRFAMTCCVEDIQFCGFKCKSEDADKVAHKSWIDITAKMKYEFAIEYKGKGPVLYAQKIEPAQKPQDDLVYFN